MPLTPVSWYLFSSASLFGCLNVKVYFSSLKMVLFMQLAFVLPLVLLLFLGSQGYGQVRDFKQTKNFISEKLHCCSVPFTPSDPSRKVVAVDIDQDGSVALFYSSDMVPQTFNLFDLYKESDTSTGIQLYKDAKFVQFHLSPERTRVISFATHNEAKEVYNAFLDLLRLCIKDTVSFAGLNFHQTIEMINGCVEKWSRGFTQVVTASADGSVVLVRGGSPDFRFNLLDLKDPYYKEGMVKNGIEAVTCTYGTVAPASWINFYKGDQSVGFLKLDCAPESQMKILLEALLHLQSLCKR